MSDLFHSINGRLCKMDEGAIAPSDRSFALGDGLFETVKVTGGSPVWMPEHISRMAHSAKFAGINFKEMENVENLCRELINKNSVTEGFLRITLSRGNSPTGRFHDLPDKATIAIVCGTLSDIPKPQKTGFAEWSVNESDPSIRHKTTSRFNAVIASQAAYGRGLNELVFTNSRGEPTEGITSNLFWAKGQKVFTPALECGLLPGITRGKVIEEAKKAGIEISEGHFVSDELLEAEEIFFTNSIIGAHSCVEFEGKQIDNKDFCTKIHSLITGGTSS